MLRTAINLVVRSPEIHESLANRQPYLGAADPFSDPPTILEPLVPRGRATSRPQNQDKMEPEIQEVRIVEHRKQASRSAAAGRYVDCGPTRVLA
jgi:hypothetical protein